MSFFGSKYCIVVLLFSNHTLFEISQDSSKDPNLEYIPLFHVEKLAWT